jgi:farnesyl diphosphate synthase
MSIDDLNHWMTATQARTEAALEARLPPADVAPVRLHQAMRYATLGGGKRVRPLLAHAAGELAGADPAAVDAVACAVELIHAYSLVHDDLPCMDDDVLRRGKPTVHVEFDEATALLVGDALQALAFKVLAEAPLAIPAERHLALVGLLAQAAGSRGMAGGQAIDLAAVGQPMGRADLEFMHIHKTGALIRAAILMGAACGTEASATRDEALDHFGKRIGLLFQVVDDILDTQADTATLGKTAGKDAAQDKPTYVTVLGLSDARALADELLAESLACLAGFGDRAKRLDQLARFIVHRKF